MEVDVGVVEVEVDVGGVEVEVEVDGDVIEVEVGAAAPDEEDELDPVDPHGWFDSRTFAS